MKNEHKERIAQIQHELRDLMARDTDQNSPESRAIMKAMGWLGNITNPLTEAESEQFWEQAETFVEAEGDLNTRERCEELVDRLSAAEKREYMLTLNEDE